LNKSPAENFLAIAEEWICDQYTLSLQYFAQKNGNSVELIHATITAAPRKPEIIENLCIQTATIIAGQEVIHPAQRAEILTTLRRATNGQISTKSAQLQLDSKSGLSHYSENQNRDDWQTILHLNIAGSQAMPISALQATQEDQELRCNATPFDGLNDLCGWLGLRDDRLTGRAASIDLRILPPVDMIFNESSIVDDHLKIALLAHPRLDTSKVKLAIKAYPGKGLSSRFWAEKEILWTQSKDQDEVSKGLLDIRLESSESALGTLILGNQTIRRQWHVDPSKSQNIRYAAIQYFDQEIRQTKLAALDSNDSRKLEIAIASLLYLLGFAVVTPVEKDAPDIIATTPNGNIVIVECTMRIADFSQKLGKLVDRRNGLSKSLRSASHHSQVHAALVCNLPRDQVAIKEIELLQHEVLLATREDIEKAFNLTQLPKNPDELIANAIQEMLSRKNAH
jgi:hypothetical protein